MGQNKLELESLGLESYGKSKNDDHFQHACKNHQISGHLTSPGGTSYENSKIPETIVVFK